MEEAFPEYAVRRGFTSQIIIDHVKSRDNVAIDNVKQALDRAVENGVKTLVIQPTHLMDGLEYHELVDEVAQYSDAFEHLAIGKPLLTSEADFPGGGTGHYRGHSGIRRWQNRHLLYGTWHRGSVQCGL